MALGGGTFIAQNKVLPGAYLNFVAAARASSIFSERGIATLPLTLSWGELGTVLEVSAGDFQKNSLAIFGYDFMAPEMQPLRELFSHIRLAYLYRIGTGGAQAANVYGKARCVGVRGNDITIVVAENGEDGTKKDVSVLLAGVLVGKQTVSEAAELKDDAFVLYEKVGELVTTAGAPMSGGIDPTVTVSDHQAYLAAVESYSFHAMGCPSDEQAVKALYGAFVKRLRDEQGVKFQCVLFNHEADYEGVVNVMNPAVEGVPAYSLVYWVTGIVAGTEVNQSALNKVYDGEFSMELGHGQKELERAIQAGKFAFHRVGNEVRVLSDVNSLVTVTAEKGEIFKENQTIRVIDQIANDIAVIFNTQYLGIVPNDKAGRISLWADIVRHHERLQDLRAIESFQSEDVKVEQGDSKRAVLVRDVVTVVNAMAQLYMVVTVA